MEITPVPQRERTERDDLVLREFSTEQDDLALFESLTRSQEHLLPFCGDIVIKFNSIEAVRRARMDNSDTSRLRMGIWLGEDNILVGEADSISRGNSIAEITYWLDVEHTGNGYATLAVRALARRAHYLAYERVVAKVREENTKSIRVLERAGFERNAKMLGDAIYLIYEYGKTG